MAKKLKVGDVIHGYRITKVFGPGMMAISYGALSPRGTKVFFKQYKSPSPAVIWYKDFVTYQRELSARVGDSKAGNFAVRQVDAFEDTWGGRCYFQAYEFVENGADLQKVLDDEREQHLRTKVAPTRDGAVWARHVTWAKVLVAGVAALHEGNIVHADLKPANAYLIQDPTIGSGYQLKLIDMDFSLLADRRAPWHGFQGYVGTDNYRSPEHMARDGIPSPASDVFTCGLMLYELLAGRHPYWSDDQAAYSSQVRAYAASPPALVGVMPSPANNAEVSQALHQCLSPDASARPTAAELRAVLSGRGQARSAPPPPVTASPGTVAAGAPRPPLATPVLVLEGPDAKPLRIGVRTELGKGLMRQFGPDAEFWDNAQCVIERNSAGQWTLVPNERATNETLLNGRKVLRPSVLSAGDLIAVGREAKGIIKLPLRVSAG
jgi:serine/threonine protein kinase